MTRARGTSASREQEPARPGTLTGIRPAQRKRLTEDVADQLLELIAAGSERELTLPVERELSQQLAVSRNVLREALSALDRQGIVETRGKTRVALTGRARAQLLARVPGRMGLTRELMLDPIEVRLILEPEAAALAAERATEPDLRDLDRWLDAMAQAIDERRSVVEYDSAFHVAIARATNNDMLADLVGALTDALGPSRERSFRPSRSAEKAHEDHRAIVAAIRAGDPDASRAAMQLHLRHVEEMIRSTIAPS